MAFSVFRRGHPSDRPDALDVHVVSFPHEDHRFAADCLRAARGLTRARRGSRRFEAELRPRYPRLVVRHGAFAGHRVVLYAYRDGVQLSRAPVERRLPRFPTWRLPGRVGRPGPASEDAHVPGSGTRPAG